MKPPQILLGTVSCILFASYSSFSGAQGDAQNQCEEVSALYFTSSLPCYVKKVNSTGLLYKKEMDTKALDVNLKSYNLKSQNWSPNNLVNPAQWSHKVDIYIPQNPIRKTALLIVNNGINNSFKTLQNFPPNDFTRESLSAISKATNTIVISVSNVPNQYLRFDSKPPSREDQAVAQSWNLFMDEPAKRETIPLQLPMVAAISQAMSLAQNELKKWDVENFILSGASKRGWTVWLSAIADKRVVAIVPMVIDILDTRATLKHIYHTYGENWPLAFTPYYMEGVTKRIDTDSFDKLMQSQDPLRYLASEYSERLAIPKYIVNASGDDFFVPDNSIRYYDRLPGEKSLRMIPNSDHAGIRNVSAPALISFTNRFQRHSSMPTVTANIEKNGNHLTLSAKFSEKPEKIKLWKASNPNSRDFRYACGIRYSSEDLTVQSDWREALLKIDEPSTGWQSIFLEATFKDGSIATSPAFTTPQKSFPQTAPLSNGETCKTLPGLGPN